MPKTCRMMISIGVNTATILMMGPSQVVYA